MASRFGQRIDDFTNINAANGNEWTNNFCLELVDAMVNRQSGSSGDENIDNAVEFSMAPQFGSCQDIEDQNEAIMCMKNNLNEASNWDPTGVTMILGALANPIC